MRCFVSHKKVRHKKSLAEQDAAAASAAKMTRTLSAPPSFTTLVANGSSKHPTLSSVMSSASPLNPQTPARIRNGLVVMKKQELQDGSSSPLISHSSGSIPNGYNSLSGLKRDSIFRGQPLPLPTPESCGLPVESPAPVKFMASPRNGAPPPLPPPTSLQNENRPVFRRNSSMPLPRPPVERFASAHITFSPDTSCIGESGNGPAFTCTVSIDGVSSNGVQESVQAVLVRLSDTTMQDSKAWIQLVKEIACLSGAHLSRILGFSFSTDEKLVVYEMQANGSLDRLLYGRSRERPPLDWFSRVRIAADAALGLAFLHEKSPNELMYKDFRTFNIHVDRSMRARLMGYGFTQKVLNTSCPMVGAYAAPEMLNTSGGVAVGSSSSPSSPSSSSSSITSNVWSFGVVLLEILTGRQNRDEMFPVEEQDLVIWTTSLLSDERKVFLVVDPELKGMFPARSVAAVAKLALQCLDKDPAARPSMKQVASALESALELDFKPGASPSVASSGSDSRKPLIEALREHSSPSGSPAAANSSALSVIQGSLQKKLVTKLLCSSTSAFE